MWLTISWHASEETPSVVVLSLVLLLPSGKNAFDNWTNENCFLQYEILIWLLFHVSKCGLVWSPDLQYIIKMTENPVFIQLPTSCRFYLRWPDRGFGRRLCALRSPAVLTHCKSLRPVTVGQSKHSNEWSCSNQQGGPPRAHTHTHTTADSHICAGWACACGGNAVWQKQVIVSSECGLWGMKRGERREEVQQREGMESGGFFWSVRWEETLPLTGRCLPLQRIKEQIERGESDSVYVSLHVWDLSFCASVFAVTAAASPPHNAMWRVL